jgi:hypothetical protein
VSAIRIINSGYPLPTYLVVNHTGDEQEWRITSIELWVDQDAPFLIYDDLRMDQLSPQIQADIVLALNEDAIRRRERAMRLARLNKELQRLGQPS